MSDTLTVAHLVVTATWFATDDPGLTGLDRSTETVLDLAGTAVFAVSGALAAVRKRFDVVGVVALAVTTAVGGGVVRDVLIADLPPAALRDWRYLGVPLAAALLVMWWHPVLFRLQRPILLFDAAGLGLFCVVGAVKSTDAGLNLAAAVGMGVLTASGGGVLRDVLSGEQPMVFRADTVLYAVPAALGALAVALAWRAGEQHTGVALATAAGVTLLRLAALRYGWRAPAPRGVRSGPLQD